MFALIAPIVVVLVGVIATPDRLLSVREVADHLSVSERTVWRFIEDGRLPRGKVGAQVRIRPDDLAAFVDECFDGEDIDR